MIFEELQNYSHSSAVDSNTTCASHNLTKFSHVVKNFDLQTETCQLAACPAQNQPSSVISESGASDPQTGLVSSRMLSKDLDRYLCFFFSSKPHSFLT